MVVDATSVAWMTLFFKKVRPFCRTPLVAFSGMHKEQY